MLLLALVGCGAGPAAPEILLSGWTYEWEELSHRISLLDVGVGEDGALALGLVGGDWSTGATWADTPTYRVRLQRVTSPDLHVRRGSVTLSVGPEGVATGVAEVDGAGLEELEATAVLNGFAIVTDVPQGPDYPADYDPAHGYTSNGFGFALGEVERDGGVLRVPVAATVRWGPLDRDDMNAAMAVAFTEVRVDVALIAGPYTAETLPLAAESDPPHEVRSYSEQPVMALDARFAGGAPEGLVGWRSFDLQLNLKGEDAGRGDYLRAFGVELAPVSAERGGFEGEVTATMSTSSLLELTDPYAGFVGELVRIGADELVSEHWLVEGAHPTGIARTAPLDP